MRIKIVGFSEEMPSAEETMPDGDDGREEITMSE